MLYVGKEEKKRIAISVKYNIRMNTYKLEAYVLFEEGLKPQHVIYALKKYDRDPGSGAFERTMRKYYSDWKKAQSKSSR